MHLFVDADTKQVTSYAKTIETASLEEQATDAKEIAGYLTEGHRLLQAQQIAQIPETLSTDLRQPHAFITVALKALKRSGADRSGCVKQRVIFSRFTRRNNQCRPIT